MICVIGNSCVILERPDRRAEYVVIGGKICSSSDLTLCFDDAHGWVGFGGCKYGMAGSLLISITSNVWFVLTHWHLSTAFPIEYGVLTFGRDRAYNLNQQNNDWYKKCCRKRHGQLVMSPKLRTGVQDGTARQECRIQTGLCHEIPTMDHV